MKRKILSVTLALSMLLALVPTMAIAVTTVTYGDLSYSVNDDKTEVTITDCDESVSGELVIPETIHAIVDYDDENEPIYKDLPVTSIGDDAFSDCSDLTNIAIPDSVTSIGNSAFYCCSSLINVKIPDGIMSIDALFDQCTSLTNITIPDSVTSIGELAFRECSSLTMVMINKETFSI